MMWWEVILLGIIVLIGILWYAANKFEARDYKSRWSDDDTDGD